MKKIYLVLFVLFLAICLPEKTLAADLKNVSLTIEPQLVSSSATWTISFTAPNELKLGHVLISLGGYAPDLSGASLSAIGLDSGTVQLGKSNPSCVSNCDDIRYKLNKIQTISAGSKIVFYLTNVKNPAQAGQTGFSYINLYGSLYPQTELIASSSQQLINLSSMMGEDGFLPETTTSEGLQKEIKDVLINELFYQKGATTTKLTEIKDPTKVENFTLDLIDKVKVVFKEPIDLSQEEAIHYIANLADYMTFEYLYFSVEFDMYDYFKVPLEVTFYDIPFVWKPDIIKDDQFILNKDEIEGFKTLQVDDKEQIIMVIKEAGGYRVTPHLELNIDDNQKITNPEAVSEFTGRISDPAAKLTIKLNNLEVKDLKPEINAETGEFTFKLELIPGPNLIEVSATSDFGEIVPITKVVQVIEPTTNVEPESPYGNPLYFAVAGLALLALLLIVVIRYLVKAKKI